MPVGPRDAVIFRRLPKRLQQLEEHIDRYLRGNYNGESWFEVPTVEVDSKILKQLIEDYRFVGWKNVVFLGKNGRKTPILKLIR